VAFDRNVADVIGQPMTQERLKLLDRDTPVYPHYVNNADSQHEIEGEGGRSKKGTATTPEELDH